MDARIRTLLSKATSCVPARRANAEIAKRRELFDASSYEMVLPPEAEWRIVRNRLAPLLHRHLRDLSQQPLSTTQVFLSIFCEESLYFMRVEDFFGYLADAESIPPTALEPFLESRARENAIPVALLGKA
ncbi:MAG: hypothetical protein FJ125_16700 [Deltaproteobacteria bacterium]|nr:hypothetical protein [Deltaproteobacteria bacterium]